MPTPRPCPGRCNQPWRDAENAAAVNGTSHDLTPVWGHPLWCSPCVERFAEALDDFPRLAASIHLQALHGTPKRGIVTTHSRAAVYAWPGQAARLITDEILDALTALEDDVRDLRRLSPRRLAGREGSTIGAASRFLVAHAEWIAQHHPIADDPEDAPPAYLMRLHARAVRFVGDGWLKPETKTTPCPRCGGGLFQQQGGDYIECGSCGRLLTAREYDEYTKIAAAAADAHWRKWIMGSSVKVELAS